MKNSPLAEWVSNQNLTSKEVRLIVHFLRAGSVVVPRETLIREIWSGKPPQSARSVDAAISKLRRKLNSERVKLITVYGMGYRWLPLSKPAI